MIEYGQVSADTAASSETDGTLVAVDSVLDDDQRSPSPLAVISTQFWKSGKHGIPKRQTHSSCGGCGG